MSAIGEGGCSLAETGWAQAILEPGFGHRQPVRFGRAPTIAAQTAIENFAAAETGELASGRFRCSGHAVSLRGAVGKRKIVIWTSRISRMAGP
jgi:hypothetical protein